MSDFDEARKAFDARLRATQAGRQPQHEADLRQVREMSGRQVLPAVPADVADRLRKYDAAAAEAAPAQRVRRPDWALVDLRRDQSLRQIDQSFIDAFELQRYLPGVNLDYPTVYAETLEEFFGPIVDGLNVSQEAQKAALDEMTSEARHMAEKSGGGVFGLNMPGRGCYINGWLFAYGKPYARQPREALADPAVFPHILSTIAHEKLGHGFITEFTPLGEEKKRLGLAQVDLARRFNLHVADSPASALLLEKNNLVFTASQFTEEGWATWVEHALLGKQTGAGNPPHTLAAVWQALDWLAEANADLREIAATVQRALKVLFVVPADEPTKVHEAIAILQQVDGPWDDFFMQAIGQPLRYAVGYLLVEKVSANAGWLAAPYAVLIAANLTYDLEHIGVSDLEHLISTNPRMNVDTRLALLATLKLPAPGSVAALAQAARSRLSLALPSRLRI